MSLTSTVAKITSLSIYNILKGEHNEVGLLFNALEASPNTETGRTGIFKKLCNELRSHAQVEQKVVYDKLKEREGAKTLIEHSEHEHQRIENMLNELESMDIATDAWLLKLSELKTVVDHHVREEEAEAFDKMHRLFSDEEARELGQEFQKQKNTELEKIKQQEQEK